MREILDRLELRLNAESPWSYGQDRFDNFSRALSRFLQAHRIILPTNRIVHVVGTNGKGTTAKALSTFLACSGRSVGLFTSPHLQRINERIQINNHEASDAQMALAANRVIPVAEDSELVHFEVLLLLAIDIFLLQEKVDFLVLEAGVGARLDPTQAIRHRLSILTPIDYDHTHLLGETLAKIATEKLASVQANGICFFATQPAEVMEVVEKFRRGLLGAKWVLIQNPKVRVSADKGQIHWYMQWRENWYEYRIPGEHSALNIALAAEAFQTLCGEELDPAWFGRVQWPGRFEMISWGSRTLVLSGDHNVAGFRSLATTLSHYEQLRGCVALFGFSRGRDPKDLLEQLDGLRFSELHLCPSSFKPIAFDALENAIASSRKLAGQVRVWSDWQEAWKIVQQSGHPILVSGSLYLVGSVRSQLPQLFFRKNQ